MKEKVRGQNSGLAPIERMGWITTLVVFVSSSVYMFSGEKDLVAVEQSTAVQTENLLNVSLKEVWMEPVLVPPSDSTAGNNFWPPASLGRCREQSAVSLD